MSGRKASEVSSLLSKGKQARMAGENSLINTVDRCKKNIVNNENEIDEILEEVESLTGELLKEAFNEFPKEAKLLDSQFKNLKGKFLRNEYDIDSIDEKIHSSNKKLEHLDNESEDIKRKIQRTPHYCDNEYRRASILVEEYKKVSKERNLIADEINKLNTKSNLDLSELNSRYNQINNIVNEIKEINKRAKDIVILRNEANKSKDFIKDLFNKIDVNLANKFMEKEYNEVSMLKNKFISMSDAEVVENLNVISEKINNFNHRLQEIYEQFKLDKSNSEEYLNSLKEILKNSEYYNPMEYIKNGDNSKIIDIFEFLSQYAKGIYINEIKDGLEKIQELIDKEEFKLADKKSDEISKIIEKAMSYATLKQETLIKNANLALDIRNVMRKMNYETKANIIDNDITKGFSITCTVGDEIIEFDKVLVDDKGDITIDIDHTEGVSGTCQNKWPDIQNALKGEGIFVQDITKNGRSILYPNEKSSIKSDNIRSRIN